MIVRLTWTEGAPGQIGDGFRVYRSVNGGAYSLVATLSLSQTSYDDSNISYGNIYRYRVVEYFGTLESEPAEVCVALSQYTETTAPSDSLSKRPHKSPAETATCSDALSKCARKFPTETSTCSDALGKYVCKSPTETSTCGDALSKYPRKSPAETSICSDSLGKCACKSPTEMATCSDTLSKGACRSPTETCTAGDLRLPFSLSRAPAETLALTDIRNCGLRRSFDEGLGATLSWPRCLARGLEEWPLLDDGDNRAIARTLPELVPVVLLYDRQGAFYRELGVEATPTDALTRSLTHDAAEEAFGMALSYGRAVSRGLEVWIYPAYAPSWPLTLGRQIDEVVEPFEETARAVQRLWEEGVETAWELWRGIGREHAEEVPAASMVAERDLVRALQTPCDLVDLATRALAHDLADGVGLGEALTRGLARMGEEFVLAEDGDRRAITRALLELLPLVLLYERSVEYRRTHEEALPAGEALLTERQLKRPRTENIPLTEAWNRRLRRLRTESLPPAVLASYLFGRAPKETLSLAVSVRRTWRRPLAAQAELWARVAAPAKSTPYPWDTGKGGLFVQKLPRDLVGAILRRGLLTAEHTRALALLILLREALAKKLDREVSLSKPLK